MLTADRSLVGFRYTRWHDSPNSAVANGRARTVVHTYSVIENVIFRCEWPLDGSKIKVAGGYLNGLQWQVNPVTPPVKNGQNWKTLYKGYLENSATHFHRFVKSATENIFFPDGLEVEAYEYCPNQLLDLRPTWTPLFGTWAVDNDVYHQTDASQHAHTRAGDDTWDNYSLEAKVKLIQGDTGGGAGICARMKGIGVAENGYALVLYQTVLKLYDTDGWNVLGQANVSVELGTSYKLKLDVNGTSLKGYLDDELKVDIVDATYSEGKIHLFCSVMQSDFDDVKVMDTSDKILLLDNFSLEGFKDLMLILFHFRNTSESPLNFTFGVCTADYSTYTGTEKYIHPDYSALVKTDGQTIIWGSDVAPQDCYMDGAWRSADYSDGTPNENWLRWSLTIDAGEDTLLGFIIIYGDDEAEAVYNYSRIKAASQKELLQKELRFWKSWLDQGKAYNIGIWEVDQLARIMLCLTKSFISFDNGSMPATTGDGFPYSHWPVDNFPNYWSLVLWGHLDEAKDYFGTYIKNVLDDVILKGYNLYKGIHICDLIDYTSHGSNYTSEAWFTLIPVAILVWKKDKSDMVYRDNVWSWIETVMDEIDGDLITSGDWKDCFEYANIYDAFESWLFFQPHSMYGNSIMTVMTLDALLAHVYEQAADLADAVGEYAKASAWRTRAVSILGKLHDFWTDDEKACYRYWGDVTGFACNMGWPSWDQWNEPLPVGPIFRISWLANINDEIMRKAVQLYYDNYLVYYKPDLVAIEPEGNWMYGKVSKKDSYGIHGGHDTQLWEWFLAGVYLGFDDMVGHFLLGIKDKHPQEQDGLFDNWSKWNADREIGWQMFRAIGLFLVGYSWLFTRRNPIPVSTFHVDLHFHGKEVVILKQTGTSTDQFGNIIPSFEPTYLVNGIVQSFRADEQIVLAGFASVDDRRFLFGSFTPVEVGDRIRVSNIDYAVQTVQKHYFKGRIVKKEVFAKKVIE
ncbi:MAG: hypothetical protein OEZ48_01380 [Candidatus Bathyarchaeota archaeon]|nr:hypothetical protein [Candidatus Bathyarchaeota archaeon]